MLLTSKDALGIVLFIVLPFAFGGLYLPYWASVLFSGRKVGKVAGCIVLLTLGLSPIIAFVVMYVGFFFPLAPVVDSSLEHYRFAFYTLPVLVGSFLVHFIIRELLRRFRLSGQSVTEVERHELKLSSNLLVYGGLILFWGYFSIKPFIEQGMTDFRYVALMEFYLVGVAFILAFVSRKKYLTREGISQFSRLIKWADILSYRWGLPDGGIVSLTFHQRMGGEIMVQMPADKREEIENFIKTWGYAELRFPDSVNYFQ